MSEHLQALPGSLFIVLTTIVGLHAAIVIFEETISEVTRARMGHRLLTGDFRKGTRKVLEIYLSLNNTLFGKRIFSLRSLGVSVILTSMWGICFMLNYGYTFPQFKNALHMIAQTPNLRNLAITAFLVILLVDYLSINVTRKIYRMTVAKGKKSFILAAITDLASSVAVYYVGLSIFKYILSDQFFLGLSDSLRIWTSPTEITMGVQAVNAFDLSSGRYTSSNTFELDTPFETMVTYMFPEGVFFISSLMTSVWLWMYLLAYTAAWFMVRVNKIKKVILPHLNIEKKPLTTLTGVATAILMLCMICSAFLKL
ncbi:hypothetical protein NAV33_18690 [Pseudomonas stutzeri]|uniref:hypothetical protein n=1 Tax=Stutzerimonas stutzeri TaxID=316 RepID=UPI00210C2DA1|nr:hypothetical protein [Stutzerimonas stutzeri]MCQ4313900.1 hypothetical protein [Stutzerimonas stutzeri]